MAQLVTACITTFAHLCHPHLKDHKGTAQECQDASHRDGDRQGQQKEGCKDASHSDVLDVLF